jgi:hypothetical protein
MKLCFLVLLLVGQAVAADDDREYTGGFTNGRGWSAMLLLVKAAYLQGLNQGSEFVKNGTHLLPVSMTFGETAIALDMYYRDPTNATMPVPMALSYVRRKAEGATEAELKDFEARLRMSLPVIDGRGKA